MADKRISDLPAATSIADTDEIELNQSGTSRRGTAGQMRAGLAPAVHQHTLADVTDAGALASLDTVGSAQIDAQAVTLDKIVDQGGITPGQFSNPIITVSQEGIITAISSGAPSGGLSTSTEGGTSVAVGDALNGMHKLLTAGTAITATLDAQASVATRCALTPAGAGAVTVAVEAGAGYWLLGDNIDGVIRTTSFGLKGYGYFEVIANSDGNSAEWAFVGRSDHPTTLPGTLDAAGQQITNSVMPLADDEETEDFTLALTHAQQKMIRCNHATTPIVITIPANTTIPFPVGTLLHFVRWGAAAVTFDDTNVTLNSAAGSTIGIANQYGVVSLWQQAADVWVAFGDIEDAS